MRLSSSALRASRLRRSSRRSCSRRAVWSAAVCLATTATAPPRKMNSQSSTQWRPLSCIVYLKNSQFGTPRTRIYCELLGARYDRLPRVDPSQCFPPANTDRQIGRAHTAPSPFPEGVFHDAIFTRVIRNDRQLSAGLEGDPKAVHCLLQLPGFIIDRHADSLKKPREVGRPRLGTQRCPDRIHKMVTGTERLTCPAAHDFRSKAPRPPLVPIIAEERLDLLDRSRVQNGGR